MPDIEFVDQGGAADDEDEILDTGTRPRLPQWVLPVAALLVLVLVVTVVATRRHSSGPQAAPTTVAPTSPSSAPAPEPAVPNGPIEDVYALVGDPAGSRLFALSGSRLFALALNGRELGEGVPVRLGAAADAEAVLLADPERHLVWVVPQSLSAHGRNNPGIVAAFDSRTLRQVGRYVLQEPIDSAAVLDGQLYLSSGGVLLRLAAGTGRQTSLLSTASASMTLVPDPSRHRLLFVSYGSPDRVGSWSPSGQLRTVPLPFLAGSLVVSGGAIWAGGGSTRRGVLVRLDPRTLRPGPNRAGPSGLRAGIALDGAGDRSLYALSETAGDSRISCLDARTGRLLARVGPIDGVFVTIGRRGYDGSAPALHPVAMGRCPG